MKLKDLTYGELASTRQTLRTIHLGKMTFDQEQAFFNALSILDELITMHLDGKLEEKNQ